MRTQAPLFRTPRIEEKRRGVRLNSRVPVIVEWHDAAGAVSRAEAFTRTVGPYGCLLVLPQELSIKQAVRLVNTAVDTAVSGIVVWKGNQRTDGWEVGIELTEPPMDFWGLDL
jgi:hypothetical protein